MQQSFPVMDFISQLYTEGEESGRIIKVDDTFRRQRKGWWMETHGVNSSHPGMEKANVSKSVHTHTNTVRK